MNATLSKHAEDLLAKLKNERALLESLVPVMNLQNEYTTAHIAENYLSGPTGPTTLSVRTNLLRASAHPSPARLEGMQLKSGIGSNVVYAAAHEFGVDKVVQVKAHERRNAIADRFKVRGEIVDRFTALRMGALSKHQVGANAAKSGKYILAKHGADRVVKGEMGMVRSHDMHMNLPARGMFRHGIQDRLADLGRALSAGVVKFWKGRR